MGRTDRFMPFPRPLVPCKTQPHSVFELTSPIPIMDKTVYISHCTNTLGKGVNPTMGK